MDPADRIALAQQSQAEQLNTALEVLLPADPGQRLLAHLLLGWHVDAGQLRHVVIELPDDGATPRIRLDGHDITDAANLGQ